MMRARFASVPEVNLLQLRAHHRDDGERLVDLVEVDVVLVEAELFVTLRRWPWRAPS